MDTRARIIEMLGNGIAATHVAAALGIDDSYVSQILAEDGVAEEVRSLRAARFGELAALDSRLDTVEEQALRKVEQTLPFVTKASEAARIYTLLNAARRKTGAQATAAPQGATILQLHLPPRTELNLKLASNKEVVEIEGRSMATLPAKSMAALLEQRTASRLLTTIVPTTLVTGKM